MRVVILAVLAGCSGVRFTADEVARFELLASDGVIPADPTNAVADDPAAARLGQYLFFDPGMSANGAVSCSTCHDPEQGFADGQALADGIATTGRHAPTALNSVFNRWFFWDGRADSHWCQALGPLEAPGEHGSSRVGVVRHVAADPALKAAYEGIFGPLPDVSGWPDEARPVDDDADDPHQVAWATMTEPEQHAANLAFSNVGKAIAAYERLLVSIDSPFDAFVAGDDEALDEQAKRGLRVFLEGDCDVCHAGRNLTDLEFHNLGLGPREGIDAADVGRHGGVTAIIAQPFNAAGAYSDDPTSETAELLSYLVQTDEQLGQFKTPSLRNLTETAPYMHGGHFDTLQEVVEFYDAVDERGEVGHRDELLLPLDRTPEDLDDLVVFLEALTGEPIPDVLRSQPSVP
jgi:cytochrome c peroxidase